MTNIEAKALALELLNAIRASRGLPAVTMGDVDGVTWFAALCRAIEREAATEARHAAELREQAERFDAFRQEVSDAVVAAKAYYEVPMYDLSAFIIAKPDPLVEVLEDIESGKLGYLGETCAQAADTIRAAIEKRGGKIVWGDDQ